VLTQSDGSYVFAGLASGTYVVRYELPSRESLPPFADPGQTVTVARNQTVAGINFATPSAGSVIDLGLITDTVVQTGVAQALYRFSTQNAGILSLVLVSSAGVSNGQVFVFSAEGRLLSHQALDSVGGRWDWQVEQNEDYFLVLSGFQNSQTVRLVNLVGLSEGTLTVHGTQGSDAVEISLANGITVTVNGVTYDSSIADLGQVRMISVDTAAGYDTVSVQLPDGDASLTSVPGRTEVTVGSWQLLAKNTEVVRVRAGIGVTVAQMSDSPGDDIFICRPGYAQFAGEGFVTEVENFTIVHGYSRSGGEDTAHMYDSVGDDTFVARPEQTVMSGNGFYHRAKFFRYVHGYSTAGGSDIAQLFGSSGNDTLVGRPDWTSLKGGTYFLRAKLFEVVQANGGNGGVDAASLIGSSGKDALVAGPRWAEMTTPGAQIRVQKFSSIMANGQAGWDTATLYDSPGDDHLKAWPGKAEMRGVGYQISLTSFEEITGKSSAGGRDVAELWDSPGNDQFVSRSRESYLLGTGFCNRVYDYALVHGYSTTGGTDVAYLDGTTGVNAWVVKPEQVTVSSEANYRRAKAFERVFAIGGIDLCDTARIFDSAGNDELVVDANQIVFRYPGSQVTLSRIPKVTARSASGTDRVVGNAVDLLLTLQGSWL